MKLSAILAIVGVLAGASVVSRAQVPTFRSRVEFVSFSVTVSDRKGKLLTDLTEPDFELYEDGVRQTLKYFVPGSSRPAPGGADSPLGPLHLGVLLDISGSMDEDMKMSRTAAIKFLKTLDTAEDITLVDFDTEVRTARYTESDFASLVERIRSRKADGMTALYDAVAVYLRGAVELDGRKVLVLYTDGGDNESAISFGDLVTLLRGMDVTVYAIGFFEHVRKDDAMELRSRLARMAEATGGQMFSPLSVKELERVYQQVSDEIHAQYTLGYVSTNTRQDGTWRSVEVKVKPRDGKNLKIRTRKGYFAPYKTPPGK